MPNHTQQERLSGAFSPTSGSGFGAGKKDRDLSKASGELGTSLASGLLGSTGLQTGFGTAEDILASKGKIDPTVENKLRDDISRNQQIAEQDLAQQTARSGLGGSSGALAVGSALQSSFAGQQAGLGAKLAADEEQRKRSDLTNILGGLFVNPALSLAGGEQTRLNTLAAQSGGPSGLEKGLGLAAGLGGAFLSGGGLTALSAAKGAGS